MQQSGGLYRPTIGHYRPAATRIMSPDRSALDEASLVRACRAGELGSFARLYAAYKDRAYSLALYMTGRADLADDITQQAFVRVHRSLHRFREEARFETWLHRIVANLCIDERRKETRARTVPLEEASVAELVSAERSDRTTLARDRAVFLSKVLETINAQSRAAILMKYVSGMSYDEIAQAQETTTGTVGSRINRGLKALREELERRDEHV